MSDGVVRPVNPGRQVDRVLARDVDIVNPEAPPHQLLHGLHLGGLGGLVQGRVLPVAPAGEVPALLQDDDRLRP